MGMQGGKGKTFLFIDREPVGNSPDAVLEYGPLEVHSKFSLQNCSEEAPSMRNFVVVETRLDATRYSDSPDAELFHTWRTRLQEVK